MEIVKGQLYKAKTSELVVMASGEQICGINFSGQVVVGDEHDSVGEYSAFWDIRNFEPYSAEIIIKEVIDFSKVQFLEMNDGEIVFTSGVQIENQFFSTNIKTAERRRYEKSDVKKVVNAKFE
jgi:hypothetical protein